MQRPSRRCLAAEVRTEARAEARAEAKAEAMVMAIDNPVGFTRRLRPSSFPWQVTK